MRVQGVNFSRHDASYNFVLVHKIGHCIMISISALRFSSKLQLIFLDCRAAFPSGFQKDLNSLSECSASIICGPIKIPYFSVASLDLGNFDFNYINAQDFLSITYLQQRNNTLLSQEMCIRDRL